MVKKLNKKSITIGNLIDVELYPLRNPVNSLNESFYILIVGSGHRHHGLSRVINSLCNYVNSSSKEINIRKMVVGVLKNMLADIKLVKKYNLSIFFLNLEASKVKLN